MEVLRAATLIAATVTMGVMTGVFQLYAYAIMPGLRRIDDRTFVGAFQSIDRAIINPLFLSNFLGALVFPLVAAALHLGSNERPVLPWIVAALVFYALVVAITGTIHLPRNDELKAAGEPGGIADLALTRARFAEQRWHQWNVVRACLCTVALGCLAWALVEYGRN